MWLQFISQNVHFAIHIFAALVAWGIAWLYFDAWRNKHDAKELFKWLGFVVLGLSFIVEATVIEQSVLGSSIFGQFNSSLVIVLRLMGYGGVIVGNILDPLQAIPKNEGLKLNKPEAVKPKVTSPPSSRTAPLVLTGMTSVATKVLMPLGALGVAALYWRRATKGLEQHLKPIARGFLLFAVADAIGVATVFRTTSNPVLYSLVSAFGLVWWLQQLTLLGGVVILGFWTWNYLLERFFSQLFMIFTGMIVAVFLFVSVGFTTLLLRSVRTNSLTNLHTAVQVLGYALASKQQQTMSSAQQLASSSETLQAVASRDRQKLKILTSNFLADNKLSSVIITDQSGQVLLRGEDTEAWGDSLSSDTLVKRALTGLGQSTVDVHDGVTVPVIAVRSAASIKDGSGTIVGSVVTNLELSSAFADGIKQATGLQSSVYAGKTLVATTLVAPNGKTRSIGLKLNDKNITNTVLDKGQSYTGSIALVQREMLGAFLPIKDVDKVPIGMLVVSQPESALLQIAGRTVELTFMLVAVLLMLSIIPVYYITRTLTRQLS